MQHCGLNRLLKIVKRDRYFSERVIFSSRLRYVAVAVVERKQILRHFRSIPCFKTDSTRCLQEFGQPDEIVCGEAEGENGPDLDQAAQF